MKSSWNRWLPPLVPFVLVLLAWQLYTQFGDVRPYILPSPGAVGLAGWEHRHELGRGAMTTGLAASCGFLCSLGIGFGAALVFSQSTLLRRGVMPYAIFLQTVPMIAIAPLILNWLGPGQPSVITVSVIVSLFPVITSATAGMLAVPADLHSLFDLYGATRWQRIWKLHVPYGVPYFVTGAGTSAGLAVIGAIVGEFFAGNFSGSQGLGFLIPQRILHLKTAEGFAAVLLSTALGLLLYGMVHLARLTLLRRWCRSL